MALIPFICPHRSINKCLVDSFCVTEFASQKITKPGWERVFRKEITMIVLGNFVTLETLKLMNPSTKAPIRLELCQNALSSPRFDFFNHRVLQVKIWFVRISKNFQRATDKRFSKSASAPNFDLDTLITKSAQPKIETAGGYLGPDGSQITTSLAKWQLIK